MISTKRKAGTAPRVPTPKNIPCMTREDWDTAVGKLFNSSIQRHPQFELESKEYWNVEITQNRYTVNKPLVLLLQVILPWFHAKEDPKKFRFRQTLKRNNWEGVTFDKVIEAIRYFLNADYSNEDLQFLRDYYSRMNIPSLSQCLTTIVAVYDDFRRWRGKEEQRLLEDEYLFDEIFNLIEDQTEESNKRPRLDTFINPYPSITWCEVKLTPELMEYASYLFENVVPDLHVPFDRLISHQMYWDKSGHWCEYFKDLYHRLPHHKAEVLRAALKIISSNFSDSSSSSSSSTSSSSSSSRPADRFAKMISEFGESSWRNDDNAFCNVLMTAMIHDHDFVSKKSKISRFSEPISNYCTLF